MYLLDPAIHGFVRVTERIRRRHHTVPRLCLFSLAFDGSMAVLGQPSFGLDFGKSFAGSSKPFIGICMVWGSGRFFWADSLDCHINMHFARGFFLFG